MADHDSPYKRLFSHPEMAQDLLQGFVHKDFIKDCDFSSLEKCNSSFVSDEWQQRESDVIWRLKWKNGDWFYIYVLLEFQSPRCMDGAANAGLYRLVLSGFGIAAIQQDQL